MKTSIKITINAKTKETAKKQVSLISAILNGLSEDQLLEIYEMQKNKQGFWKKVAKALKNPFVKNHLK